MYDVSPLLSVAAGQDSSANRGKKGGELFLLGAGSCARLGNGGTQNELVPRLVEALGGKKVVGASASDYHTAVRTEDGEVFTFGHGGNGKLGHGGEHHEPVPRLVEALLDV